MDLEQFERNNGKRPSRASKTSKHDSHLGATETAHYGSGQAGSAVGWDDAYDEELRDFYGFPLPHKRIDV